MSSEIEPPQGEQVAMYATVVLVPSENGLQIQVQSTIDSPLTVARLFLDGANAVLRNMAQAAQSEEAPKPEERKIELWTPNGPTPRRLN